MWNIRIHFPLLIKFVIGNVVKKNQFSSYRNRTTDICIGRVSRFHPLLQKHWVRNFSPQFFSESLQERFSLTNPTNCSYWGKSSSVSKISKVNHWKCNQKWRQIPAWTSGSSFQVYPRRFCVNFFFLIFCWKKKQWYS